MIDFMEDYISDFLLNEFHDERMVREKLHRIDKKIHKAQKENYSGNIERNIEIFLKSGRWKYRNIYLKKDMKKPSRY